MIDDQQINALIDLLGKEKINSIRLQYVEDSTDKIEQLRLALIEKDRQTLQEVSHSLKSSSLNMAVNAFAKQCEKIEQLTLSDEFDFQIESQHLQALIDQLPDVHAQSLLALETYFQD